MERWLAAAAVLASVTVPARAELSGPMRDNFIASSDRACFESVGKQGKLVADENIRIVKSACHCMSTRSADVATADDVIDAAAHREPDADFQARVKSFLEPCFNEAVHAKK